MRGQRARSRADSSGVTGKSLRENASPRSRNWASGSAPAAGTETLRVDAATKASARMRALRRQGTTAR